MILTWCLPLTYFPLIYEPSTVGFVLKRPGAEHNFKFFSHYNYSVWKMRATYQSPTHNYYLYYLYWWEYAIALLFSYLQNTKTLSCSFIYIYKVLILLFLLHFSITQLFLVFNFVNLFTCISSEKAQEGRLKKIMHLFGLCKIVIHKHSKSLVQDA